MKTGLTLSTLAHYRVFEIYKCPYLANETCISEDRARYWCVLKVALFILMVVQDQGPQPCVVSLGMVV